MSGEKSKGKISPSLIVAVVVIIVLLAALVYYATLPPAVAPPITIRETVTLTAPISVTTVRETTTVTVPAPVFNWKKYAGTTLKVLLKEGYETAAVKQFIKEFEDLTGIKVEMEVYDEPTLRKKFVFDATAKTGVYDVVAVQFWYFSEYDRAGWLEPLDGYIATSSPPNFIIGDFHDGLIALYKGADKHQYVIPVSTSGGALIYRKDILEKHNLASPVTVKDVVELAKKLKTLEPTLYPFIGRGTPDFPSFGTSAGWAWAYGAKILDVISPKKIKVTINTPEMLDAMKDLVTLLKDYGPPGQAGIGWDVMSEMYRKGLAIMNFEMTGFPWVYGNPALSGVAGKIDYTLLTGPGNKYAQWLYSEGLGISKFSKNKEAAWLFIVWRCSYDMWIKEVEAGIRFDLPSKAIYKDPRYWTAAEKQGVAELAKKISEVLASVDGAYWPWIPEFVQVAEAFQSKISSAIAGEITVEDALKTAQSAVEKILTDAGYEVVGS